MASIEIPSLSDFVAYPLRPICNTLPGDYGGSLAFVKAIEQTPGLLPLLQQAGPEDVIVDENGTLDPTKACKVKYLLALYGFHKDVVAAYEKNFAAEGQPPELRVLNAINVLATNPFKNVFSIMAPRLGSEG